MQEKRDLKSMGAAMVAMIFWSFSFVWVKIAYLAYGPLTVIFFRLILSVGLLLILSLFVRKLQKLQRKDYPIFILLALFEPFLYFMGESYGLLYVSSTVAAVIVATIPLFAPVVAWYLYRERLSPMNILGLGISFLGVCLVILNNDLSFSASPKGVLLEFLAVFSAVGYSAVLRKLAFRYNTYTIITYQNFIGIFMFLPFWSIFEAGSFLQTPFHMQAFRAIVLLSVFASTVAFILFTFSVRTIGINRSNVFVNLIPVFTAIFAWFILGDQLTWQKFAGISVVIAGLFLAQIKRRRSVVF
jgi:drug/metabolite transporter (DMT)-like permease